MPAEKSFWATLPGIITGLAAVVTAITGLIVALNATGMFSKPATTNKPITEIKKDAVNKPADSAVSKPVISSKPAISYKPVFSMAHVTIEDHEYFIIDGALDAITPATNSLSITIRYKNNSNYSPATFWNEGFRLAIDGSYTAPSGDLNLLVDRHAELTGTVTFEVPNNAKNLVLHILDVQKDIAVPITLTIQ